VRQRYRTVWISDLHLGSRACRAEELSRFLKHVRCDRLYLVGDVIDMSRLRGRWYWPAAHNDVLRRILNHAKHGTEVVLLPGNHDDAARQFHGHEFGGVKVLPYAVHITADGRKLLVIHGDQYDLIIQTQPFLSNVGGMAYDWLVVLNRWVNKVRRALGKTEYSLSQKVKAKVKTACQAISKYEHCLLAEAKRRRLDGVVCGHIHKAEIRSEEGIAYINCGDWVESCTAVAEDFDGKLEVIHGLDWLAELDQRLDQAPLFDPAKVKLVEEEAEAEADLEVLSGARQLPWEVLEQCDDRLIFR